jgi:hypothetical protein
VVGFDNVSHIPVWLSDALCRTVTGDALTRRRLYRDNDIVVNVFKRVVLVNGVYLGALRGDLADRTAYLNLDPIPEEQRREDTELHQEFEHARPGIFGALLDLLAATLRRLPHIKLRSMPRMADYAKVLVAIDEETGLGALPAFLGVRRQVAQDVVEGDPVALAIRRLLTETPTSSWEGTATELLDLITPDHPDRNWPATPQSLSGRLRRAAPDLRGIGIQVEFTRSSDQRTIRINTARESSSSPSSPSPAVNTNTAMQREHPATGDPAMDHAIELLEDELDGTVIDFEEYTSQLDHTRAWNENLDQRTPHAGEE